MKKENQFQFTPGVIGYPLLFVLAIWIVFWFEIRFGFDFNSFGIYPLSLKGLRGIIFSPFIHGDIQHLWHNTLPLLILSTALFYFYSEASWKVLFLGLLFTGLGTWFLGRSANHIGASGVIYMLFGFLFFKGILAKHFRLIALSFFVVFMYGSMVWYVAPIDPKISWEGHLSGLVVGVLLSFVIKKGIVKPNRYIWEEPDYNPEDDDFLKHFDENGNFIEIVPEENNEIEQGDGVVIKYEFKSSSDKKEEKKPE